MADQVADLLLERVAVDPQRHRAARMGRQLAADPVGVVVADQRHHVAAADPQVVEGERDAPDLGEVAGPGDLVPDAEILYPQRHLVGSRLRVQAKQLGQRVVDRWIGITHRSKSLPVPQLDRKEPERHRAFARHARLPARFFPVRSTALSPTALLAVRPGVRNPIPDCYRRVPTGTPPDYANSRPPAKIGRANV